MQKFVTLEDDVLKSPFYCSFSCLKLNLKVTDCYKFRIVVSEKLCVSENVCYTIVKNMRVIMQILNGVYGVKMTAVWENGDVF